MTLGRLALILVLLAAPLSRAAADDALPFEIRVVDQETGRGVPLVEFQTVHGVRYVTDSAGRVAFREPGLMGLDVYFGVTSHGYRFPADAFGFEGRALRTEPGGSATLEIERDNIAERLYRVTGQGIYHDTAVLGREAPLERPLLNARVMGQDSVLNAVYRGKLYWFWGDTSRPAHPLGQFRVSGAVSDLPEDGGLDPSVGVNLQYFTDERGFSRPMMPAPELEGGVIWLDGLLVQPDASGRPRLLAHYSRMASLAERLDHGIARYNDTAEVFEVVRELSDAVEHHPRGHPLRVTADDRDAWYFAFPYPTLRVAADLEAVMDPDQYEAFTCLEPGTRWGDGPAAVERDAHGRVRWAWKRGTAWVDHTRQQELIDAGRLDADEAWNRTVDAATGRPIHLHGGSVAWNPHRGRWVMIAVEQGGSSLLGEVWYAEADQPHGPYDAAVKIVTHDDYSFYNPKQHPYFAEADGRTIYFEGTYTRAFSGTTQPTPRYDYNQIMYRLDVSDPRLAPAQGGSAAPER